MTLIITVVVFIAVLCIIEGVSLLLKSRFDGEARRIREGLKRLSDESKKQTTDLRRSRPLSATPWFDRVLSTTPFMKRLDALLVQSNLQQPLGSFVLLSLGFACVGVCAGLMLVGYYPLLLLVALIPGLAPIFYILMKKRLRTQKFERQLPEALDLIARSLRAGHALSTGLRMVAQEFDDPCGTEFRKAQAQIGLGVGIDQALKALTERIDCPDLRFFAVSVIIQRETGGNLADILESISNLIRNRFRLRGRISALTAEGRLSAIILLGMPFAIALVLSALNPSYVKVLVSDPIGKGLIGGSLLMMALGIVVIKRMVDVKV